VTTRAARDLVVDTGVRETMDSKSHGKMKLQKTQKRFGRTGKRNAEFL
jgi:hypothetical protein